MKTQHTPGPWRLMHGPQDGKTYVVAGPKTIPFQGQIINYPTTDPNSEANARLIAAAPELLEACQQALFAIPTTHGAFETVRDAIAKAIGDS